MNFAHLHLLLNHAPIIGIPLCLLFLSYGLWSKNKSLQTFSLILLVGFAALALPVFLTGEPAEDIIESIPGVTESVIEPHEEVGQLAMLLSLATGAAALLALWFRKNDKLKTIFISGVLALGILATGLLLRTGFLGGQIRHTEIRPDFQTPPSHSRE